MPIRGMKNPMPTKGKAPTGIFSTRGSQKNDGMHSEHMSLLNYAKKGGKKPSKGGKKY